jgi:hypothetical protein
MTILRRASARVLLSLHFTLALTACHINHRDVPFEEIQDILSSGDLNAMRALLGKHPAATDKEITTFLRGAKRYFPRVEPGSWWKHPDEHTIVASLWNLEIASRHGFYESFEASVRNPDGDLGTLYVAYCTRGDDICYIRLTLSTAAKQRIDSAR